MKLDIHEPIPLITTQSAHLDLTAPDPYLMDVDEMAMSLSRQARYTGHSDHPISIGQHLLLCGVMAETLHNGNNALILQALTHDAHEAYTGDICRPMKKLVNRHSNGLLDEIERRLDNALRIALGLSSLDWLAHKEAVKRIDNMALAVETAVAFKFAHAEWSGFEVPGDEHLVEFVARFGALVTTSPEDVAELWSKAVHIYCERIEEEYEDAV